MVAGDDTYARLNWHTALASAGGDCVEVAMTQESVFVRNSKDARGPMLNYTHSEWAAFVTGVRNGEFDVVDGASKR